MKGRTVLLEDYMEEMKWVYINARWEAYYELALIPLLRECCTPRTKVVPVHATRKSGRKSPKKHFIEMYSYVNGKGKRCGVPDYVIVPLESTYDNPQEALIFIEFKSPIGLGENYIPLRMDVHYEKLISQSQVCDYIIFTDGITWFFVQKCEGVLKCNQETICLVDNKWEDLKKSIVMFINKADESKNIVLGGM